MIQQLLRQCPPRQRILVTDSNCCSVDTNNALGNSSGVVYAVESMSELFVTAALSTKKHSYSPP